MLKYILLIATLFLIGVNSDNEFRKESKKYFELTKNNFALIKNELNPETIDSAIKDLYNIEGDDIIIYIDVWADSIESTSRILDVIDNLQEQGKVIHCIANYALGMGFTTFLRCDYRYVHPYSRLIKHQSGLYVVHDEFNKIRNRFHYYERAVSRIHMNDAEILNKTFDEYNTLIKDGWYLFGSDALNHGVAHSLASVSCSYELMTSTFEFDVSTWFGNALITYSRCPVINSIISVNWYNLLSNSNKNSVRLSCNDEPTQEIIKSTPIGFLSITYKECNDRVLPVNVELINRNKFSI